MGGMMVGHGRAYEHGHVHMAMGAYSCMGLAGWNGQGC